MRLIERPYCERLGTPFAQDLGPGLLSPEAIAHPPVFQRARAVASFDGAARDLIHLMKYNDRPEFAQVLGPWMARAGQELLADADVLVPVPLHRRRLWRRRFNQAALLACSVGKSSRKRVALTALERVKATQSQVGMTRAERAANIQGAFRLSESGQALRGARVLLVDDVMTTGATANAASRVLLRGGAAGVDLLVFAQVVTRA
jgi:ComF family protein